MKPLLCCLCLISLAGLARADDEDTRNDLFCENVEGQREVRHAYTYPTGQSYVLVDCETEDTGYCLNSATIGF